jgi:hypothetical protein
MADLKISQLTALLGASAANNDVLAVVDTSATTTKKIALSELVEFIVASGVFIGAVGNPIDADTIDAKGDLLVGSADNTVQRLQVNGTNGYVLTTDSTQTLGVKWAAVPASPVDSDQAILSGAVFN